MLRSPSQSRQYGLQSACHSIAPHHLEEVIAVPAYASARGPQLYISTDRASWLWSGDADFPLCISHRSLCGYDTLKPATGRWMLSSGSLGELCRYGRLVTSTRYYVAAVARYDAEIGGLDWAAPPDWPCHDAVLRGGHLGELACAGTALSAGEHQTRTVDGFLEVTRIWPELAHQESPCGPAASPFMPVVHGVDPEDFIHCAQLYEDAGVRLADHQVVGVGSVCQRNSSAEIAEIAAALAPLGLALHWFGVKLATTTAASLTSYDVDIDGKRYDAGTVSLNTGAWSAAASHRERLPGCTHVNPRTGKPSQCTNCPVFASAWRRQKLDLFAA